LTITRAAPEAPEGWRGEDHGYIPPLRWRKRHVCNPVLEAESASEWTVWSATSRAVTRYLEELASGMKDRQITATNFILMVPFFGFPAHVGDEISQPCQAAMMRYHPYRKPGPDGESRLDIEIALSDSLAACRT
jgi:hypothetical protein